MWAILTQMLQSPGGGGTRSILERGGPTELHIANPPKNTHSQILDPQKYLASKFPIPKNTRLNINGFPEHKSLKKSLNECFSDPLITTKTGNAKFAWR